MNVAQMKVRPETNWKDRENKKNVAVDQPSSWFWLVTFATLHDSPATLSHHHKDTRGRRPGFLHRPGPLSRLPPCSPIRKGRREGARLTHPAHV
jgi:hypothetical protein